MKAESKGNLITLKTLRRMLGMTQEQFAKAMGVSRDAVSDWENGKYNPAMSIGQMQILDRLLQKAGLTIHDLPPDISNR